MHDHIWLQRKTKRKPGRTVYRWKCNCCGLRAKHTVTIDITSLHSAPFSVWQWRLTKKAPWADLKTLPRCDVPRV